MVGGWGKTDLVAHLPAARLKVLPIKVLDWHRCKRMYSEIQIYHVCAGVLPRVFSQGTCAVHTLLKLLCFY
jgi:hypothetical protein